MTQPMPGKPAENAENELDIRGLFRTLWAGKLWIVGMGLAFALIALAYTFFARQEWSATAITDRPTVNMLGGYYSQQQFLRNLDERAGTTPADQPSVMDEGKNFVGSGFWPNCLSQCCVRRVSLTVPKHLDSCCTFHMAVVNSRAFSSHFVPWF